MRRRRFGQVPDINIPDPGEVLDVIGGAYRTNIDYTQEKYVQSLQHTASVILRVVEDVDRRLEKQQKIFFAGMGILVAIPVLAIYQSRK